LTKRKGGSKMRNQVGGVDRIFRRALLCVVPAFAVGLVILLGGAFDSDAPPTVYVSVAPVSEGALPEGAAVEVATPVVAEGARSVESVSGADKNFPYDILTSNANDVTILAATATADVKDTPVPDAPVSDAPVPNALVSDAPDAPATDATTGAKTISPASGADATTDIIPKPDSNAVSAPVATDPDSEMGGGRKC
jgi:hypothetical protein